jgi:hypothetical protein
LQQAWKDPPSAGTIIPIARVGLLALLAAAPASAQVGAGGCNPHRGNEVRCAIRIDVLGGHRVYDLAINAARMGAEARMTIDTCISTCGSAGPKIGRNNIANSGSRRVATFTNERNHAGMVARAVAGFCVEIFLLNCALAGQPANCQQVINMGASKIELR